MSLRRVLINRSMASGCLAPYRQRLIGGAAGDVLDLGCGAGGNFPHFDGRHVDRVIGLEPDPANARCARRRARARDVEVPVFVREQHAASMDCPDGGFDVVTLTFALCTIADPAAALAEVWRVLRPGGRIIFLEHGLAPGGLARALQRRLEPLNRWLGEGCHLTRNPPELLAAGGFRVELELRHRLPWGTAVEGSLYGGLALRLDSRS